MIQPYLPRIFEAPEEWASAQWVRLVPGGKTPIGPWRESRPSYGLILDHAAAGGSVGVVPGSVGELVRLAVLDVDGGDVAMLIGAYPPVAVAKTRRGFHVWYHSPGPGLGNGRWSGPGRTFGDVRGVAGYVKLWDDEVTRVDSGLVTLAPGACPAPLHLVTAGGRRTGPGARAAAQQGAASARRASALLQRAMVDATPVSIGANVGGRHGLMVRRLSKWGGRRTWQGVTVDDYWIALRCAAYWLGLPDRETFSEREAAGILDWTLRMRPGWVTDRVHAEAWLKRQQERARQQTGRARRASVRTDASNEAWRPWEAEGISRRTWYRRRARER